MATGLTWDAAKKRYRRDGRLLTQRQHVVLRDTLADIFAARFESLADAYVSGSVRWARFGRDFLRLVSDATTAGYVFGRGGPVAMTDDDYTTLLGLVTTQGDYARRFLDDIEAAEQEATSRMMPEIERVFIALPRDIIPETVGAIRRGLRDQLIARAKLYAGAVVKAYEWAREKVFGVGLHLPAQPGDMECDGQCRCSWSTVELDDRWECTWTLAGGGESCAGCKANADAWAPLVVMR